MSGSWSDFLKFEISDTITIKASKCCVKCGNSYPYGVHIDKNKKIVGEEPPGRIIGDYWMCKACDE